ncbi:MAG: histidine--tRNA ligase [Clostridiaceae bacterium]|nr:histidine--tRNA ligase [Clostridiaceae bacterium]
MIQAPKGTYDVLPEDSYKWQYLERILRDTAKTFGYREIRFPMFEHTELFIRGVGDTTDVVQKEMYTFTDKGGRSISLRPEGTASVVRAMIEHGGFNGALPVKCYYIAPNFRYEKPQAGRYRQHNQFGVECFGAKSPSANAEVISLADTFLKRLGIRDITAHINSIGCPNCRPKYYEALKAYFEQYKDQLCPTCLERLDRNPMRLLDCKSPVCSEIAKDAPRTIDYLCDDCKTDFDETLKLLSRMGVDYQIDSGIVRGLDYYTGPVFEFIASGIGAQGTVCGGGRYDGLVEQLGGKPTPALGFGSGMERLLLVMEQLGVPIPGAETIDVYVATTGKDAGDAAQKLILELRRMGISAERDLCDRSLKAQMKYADKIGARYTMVIGDDELAAGTANLKNMQTGEQIPCVLSAATIEAVL